MRLSKTVMQHSWVRELLIFLFLLLVTFLNEREDFSNDHGWTDGMFVFLLLYIHMQVNRFWFLPILYERKYIQYVAYAAALIILFTILALASDFYLTNVGWFDEIAHSKIYLTKFYLFSFSMTVPLLVAVHSLNRHYEQALRQEREKALLGEMELNLLKGQLNPHFLFNALNSIYGLSLDKSDELPDKILQMADIMRYHVQLSEHKMVSLQKEFHFLEQYIAFESDRQRMHVQVDKQFDIDYTAPLPEIAPVLLITFVENAFKHVRDSSTGCYIKIHLQYAMNSLILHVENSSADHKGEGDSLQTGLENARRRLELLYANRYALVATKQPDRFVVYLQLSLHETA